MKKTLTVIVLSLAGVFLTGCNKNQINEYDLKHPLTIVGKTHQAEREYVREDSIPIFLGDAVMYISNSTDMIDDEDFIFNLKNDKNEEKTIYVKEETFGSFKIGNKCDLTKINYETTDYDFEK